MQSIAWLIGESRDKTVISELYLMIRSQRMNQYLYRQSTSRRSSKSLTRSLANYHWLWDQKSLNSAKWNGSSSLRKLYRFPTRNQICTSLSRVQQCYLRHLTRIKSSLAQETKARTRRLSRSSLLQNRLSVNAHVLAGSFSPSSSGTKQFSTWLKEAKVDLKQRP